MFQRIRVLFAPERRDDLSTELAKTDRTAPALAPGDLVRVNQSYARMKILRSGRHVFKRASAVLIAAGLGLAGAPDSGSAQTADAACGIAYTVASGDTLYKIADRVYGDGSRYEAILAANAPVLTSDARLDIGDRILVPCLDGIGPQTRAKAVALGLLEPEESVAAAAPNSPSSPAEPEAAEAALESDDDLVAAAVTPPTLVHAVSGPGFAPFSGPELPGGGLIPTLVARAFEAGGDAVDLAFAENPTERLDMLASGAGRDLAYPFFRPDCEAGALAPALDPVAQRQCDDFVFSDPVYAIPVGVYVRRGDTLAGARSLADLRGKRLCRPAGHFTFDLEQAELTGDGAALDTTGSAEDCFRALAEGRTDAVTMSRHAVAPILRRLQLAGTVTEARALAAHQTLHVIADRTNPEALALLERINRAMEDLRLSGAWFDTVLAYQARREALVN